MTFSKYRLDEISFQKCTLSCTHRSNPFGQNFAHRYKTTHTRHEYIGYRFTQNLKITLMIIGPHQPDD